MAFLQNQFRCPPMLGLEETKGPTGCRRKAERREERVERERASEKKIARQRKPDRERERERSPRLTAGICPSATGTPTSLPEQRPAIILTFEPCHEPHFGTLQSISLLRTLIVPRWARLQAHRPLNQSSPGSRVITEKIPTSGLNRFR